MLSKRTCRYLLTGMILLFTACGRTMIDYQVRGEFHYVNATSQTVRVRIVGGFITSLENYTIAPNDSIILKIYGETHLKTAEPLGYKPGISGDTTTIVFRDTLCYSEYHFAGPILQNIYNYTWQKRADRDYVFFFKIDSSILNKAKRCQ